jgi:hypothetical protein
VEHPSELVADFREFYSCPWRPGTENLPWGEAWHLVKQLLVDPRSRLHAVEAGWSWRASHELLALYALIDVYVSAHSKNNAQKMPRPWDAPKHYGATETNAREILKRKGIGYG